MRTLRAGSLALLAFVVAVLALVATTPPARADDVPADWKVSRYQQDAHVMTNGDAVVTTTIDFDFGGHAGHGPYLTFPTRQAIDGDPAHWRVLDITDVSVTSPSGAPATVDEQKVDGGVLLLRIGDRRKKVDGVQTYFVRYRLHGLATPHGATGNLDEVNWNAVGAGWQVPLANVDVTLHLPAAATRVACATPSGPCSRASSPGRTVTFHQDALPRGRHLQVVAGMPAGTLVGADVRLADRHDLGYALRPNPANLAPAVGIVLVAAAVLLSVRRRRRDLVHAGVTPGLTPLAGDPGAGTGHAAGNVPVAVAFTPPAGVTPGEAGMLLHEQADSADVSATIIDLAVRGHVRITPLAGGGWRFDRLAGTGDALARHEVSVLGTMFPKQKQVTSDQLEGAAFARLLPDAKAALGRRVTDDRHWFTSNPARARSRWLVTGLALALLGGLLVALGTLVHLAWPGVGVIVAGLAVAATSRWAPVRTADGSAVLAQVRGFELYLTTAEADTLRLDDGSDVFSRYLPWAIAFGVAGRWTALFERLAAEGRYDLRTDWYAGGHTPGVGLGSLAAIGDGLTSSMQASVAASGSTSGGSGGGVGGGGGGGW